MHSSFSIFYLGFGVYVLGYRFTNDHSDVFLDTLSTIPQHCDENESAVGLLFPGLKMEVAAARQHLFEDSGLTDYRGLNNY